jgi:hypothetical protein
VLVSAVRWFKRRTSVWLTALGLLLALIGLVIASGESIRHIERVAPLNGVTETGKPASDSLPSDAYRRPGSSFWRTP